MAKQAKKCGTCKHPRPRSDGKPFWHGHAYACLWKPPEIKYPDSWTADRVASVSRGVSYMEPGAGKECPCWESAS